MIMYWWVVAVFNAIISAYSATVYIAACPEFYTFKSCEYCLCQKQSAPQSWLTCWLVQCVFGKGLQRSIALAISQMVLDITSDLLRE